MYLYVPSRGFIDHVTEEDILALLPGEELAILHLADDTYIQCLDEGPAGYALEYQDGSLQRHFEAVDGPITLERVLSAFVKYLRNDPSWRGDFQWSRMNLPGVEPLAAGTPSENPYQSPALTPPLPRARLSWASYRFYWNSTDSAGLPLADRLLFWSGPAVAFVVILAAAIMTELPVSGFDRITLFTEVLPPIGIVVFSVYLPMLMWQQMCQWIIWRRRVVWPLRQLEALVENNPRSAHGYFERGELLLFRTAERERAITDFTTVIDLEPDNSLAYARRGEALYAVKDHERALADVTQAIALAERAGESEVARSCLYSLRGKIRQELEQWHAAIDDLTSAIDLLAQELDGAKATAGGPEAAAAMAIWFYARAMLFRRLGDRTAARRDFAAAHRHDRWWTRDPRPLRRYLPVYLAVVVGYVLFVGAAGLAVLLMHFVF